MTIEQAIQLACRVHEGQLDLAGEPYILHVLRVVLEVEGEELQPKARIVAALHDTVEDYKGDLYGLVAVRQQFGEEICEAVDALTRQPGETYEGYIGRVCRNRLAWIVKRADLTDNLQSWRKPYNEDRLRTEQRRAKYRAALAQLSAASLAELPLEE